MQFLEDFEKAKSLVLGTMGGGGGKSGSIILGRFGKNLSGLKQWGQKLNARVLDQAIPKPLLEQTIKAEIDAAKTIFVRMKDVKPGTFTYDFELKYIGSKPSLMNKTRFILDE